LNEALIYAVTSAVTSADTSAEMAEQAEHLDEKFPYLDSTENWLPKP
jgi:5'(3')-deoxyribonucleotidase